MPPFAIKTDEDTWNGVSIALWRAIAEDLDYETEFREYPDVTSLLAAVEKSEVDVGVAAITVTADREKHVDFSMPFYTSGIGVAVRKTDKGSLGAALKSLASPKIIAWIAPFVWLLVAIGVLAWLLERRHNSEHFDKRPLHGIWDGIWFAAVTMTTVGYGDKSPKTLAGRLLSLVWMFSGLVLISLFTATAASLLTQSQLQAQIHRAGDLTRYRCGTVGDSTSGNFLADNNLSYMSFANVDETLTALLDDRIDACVYDAPTLRYFSHTQFGGRLNVLQIRFEPVSYAIALPSGSVMRKPINIRLLEETEGEGWHDRVERLLGK